jgi:G3E family GTPase
MAKINETITFNFDTKEQQKRFHDVLSGTAELGGFAALRYRALTESDTDLAANICKRVAELPDRSSPDDWPEAMLVTHDELEFIVVDELLTEIDRLKSQS